MKSPIKESLNNFKCSAFLKTLIPRGSIVNSFLFFDGGVEFNLTESDRFVVAHTTKYVIYEFWKCALENPKKITEISKFLFPIEDQDSFHILQENWPKYKDPYARSALFFLLNRCSESGFISAGKFTPTNYNPIALSYLNNFQVKNFHIKLNKVDNFIEGIENARKSDYLLLPVGKFSYNFFEDGKSRGFEMTTVDHKKLFESLHQKEEKWIIIYKAHDQLYNLYKDHNITMLNRYGKAVTNPDKAEEVVIANF